LVSGNGNAWVLFVCTVLLWEWSLFKAVCWLWWRWIHTNNWSGRINMLYEHCYFGPLWWKKRHRSRLCGTHRKPSGSSRFDSAVRFKSLCVRF
jgi:hypothetical protein